MKRRTSPVRGQRKTIPTDSLPWVVVSKREFTAYGPFLSLDDAREWIKARSQPELWVYRKLYPAEAI